MTSIQRLADDITRIELPASSGSMSAQGMARNVFLVHGDAPALIDTGDISQRDALLSAFDELGIAPKSIRRIALTARSVDAFGNIDAFPNARIFTVAGEVDIAERRAYLHKIYSALQALPEAPAAWAQIDIDAALNAWFAEAPDVETIRDGEPLRLGNRVFDALRADGLLAPAGVYYAADTRTLFGGPTLSLVPRPVPYDPDAWLQTIGKLGRLSTATLLPAYGPVEPKPSVSFRAASLYATNLRTNLQHVLDTWRSSIDIAEADLGYLPDDMLRFGGTVMTFDAVMREFVAAGVVHAAPNDSHPLPRYKMGAGSGRVAPKPI